MKGDNYNITVAEGGFIVNVNKSNQPEPAAAVATYTPMVFADSSALINFLHNELTGSN